MFSRAVAAALLVGCLLVAALAFAPAPSAGAHPPVPLCGGCTGGFEAAAADHGASATVQHSELELRVSENATVVGVATVRVDERAANRFHENASLLDAVARDAFVTPERSERSRWAGDAPVRAVEDVRASVADRTVTVQFRLPEAATTGVGGVVYSDLLKRNGTVGRLDLAVDAFRFVGPEGAAVTRAPGGSVDGARASWRPADDERVGYGGYVAWSDGGVAGTVATAASVWLGEATTEYPRLADAAGLGVVLGAGLSGLLVAASRRFDESTLSTTPRRLAVAYGVVAVGSVAATAALVFGPFGSLGLTTLALAPGAVVAAGALAALSLATDDPAAAVARVPTAALVALPVLAGLTLVVGVASPGSAALWAASASVLLVGALGVASTRGPLPTTAVAVAFALAPASVAFPALSPSNVGSPSVALWVVLVTAAGVPLFAFGRTSEGTADGSRDAKRQTSATTVDGPDPASHVDSGERGDADAQR